MSNFRFGLNDRVNVPHFINVQGIVAGISDHIVEGKRYIVNWLTGTQLCSQQFSHDEIVAANVPPPAKAVPEQLARAFELGQTAASVNRKRKRKPAKKKAPKRKR